MYNRYNNFESIYKDANTKQKIKWINNIRKKT